MPPNPANKQSPLNKASKIFPNVPKPDYSFKKSLHLSEEERSALFSYFVTEGSVTEGHTDDFPKPSEIPWANPELLKKGRAFVYNNYALVLLLAMVGDTVGFVAKQIASTVFKAFYPQNTCGMRFLSTFNTTLNSWLLSEDFGFENEAISMFIKDTRRVRNLHKFMGRPKVKPVVPPPELDLQKYSELVKIIKHDLRDVDTSEFSPKLYSWEPEMYFTQMDVALVQFGMYAAFLATPKQAGYHGPNYDQSEELRGYLHIWAVVAKMLGLQDRFNLALYPDPELYRRILTQLGLGALKNLDEAVLFSMEKMVDGIFQFTMPGMVTYKSLIMTSAQAAGAGKMEGLWRSMDWHDKFSFYGFKVTSYLQRFKLVRMLNNLFARTTLNLYVKLYLKRK